MKQIFRKFASDSITWLLITAIIVITIIAIGFILAPIIVVGALLYLYYHINKESIHEKFDNYTKPNAD